MMLSVDLKVKQALLIYKNTPDGGHCESSFSPGYQCPGNGTVRGKRFLRL